MKLEIYKLEKQLGTVELASDDSLIVVGDDKFKEYIKQLQGDRSAKDFVEGLPQRLRSYIYTLEAAK